jgi:hypothetical protein
MLRDVTGAKQLSNALKALGANAGLAGSLLVEGASLQGRGVGDIDLEQLARDRTQQSILAGVFDVDQGRLASVVRTIFEEEIDLIDLEFEDVDRFWDRRWLWCVNGSHNRAAEILSTGTSIVPADLPRSYRKAYVEAKETNSMYDWHGRSYFSASRKYEHGKVRAIYGGDTETYIHFEHLLKPVEKCWRGRRVVLNPGYNGMAGMAARINLLRGGSGVNVMMDFEDFNSAHSLESQATVFKVLCDYVGYPAELGNSLVASFGKSTVLYAGKPLGRLQGTLMSGHRATSFINSVLNRAYIAIASPTAGASKSIHVGDDVFITASSLPVAGSIMDEISRSALRMNPVKQSIGFVCAEFLRAAITRECGRGYAARAIASIVSGNWVSEYKLSAREGLNSLINSAWSLANRCETQGPNLLLINALCRFCPVRREVARALLTGEAALGDGPVRQGLRMYRRYDVVELDDTTRAAIPPDLPLNATRSYLSKCTTELERMAVDMTGVRLLQVMATSSYKKSLAEDSKLSPRCVVRRSNFAGFGMAAQGTTTDSLLKERAEPGVLTKYPLLSFMRNGLSKSDVTTLLRLAGETPGSDPLVQAWGGVARGVIVYGALPRGDICTLSARTTASTICVSFPMHF